MSQRATRQTSIENPWGYKVLVGFSMLYMSIMLCNAVLTNRYIGVDDLFVLGGTFTSPFVFVLDNIIAELYGYRITQAVIVAGFIAQTIFVFVCNAVLMSPHPIFFTEQYSYDSILGWSLIRINCCGFFAYIIANLSNSYILCRWKVLVKGRHFWKRSIGSSVVAELLYSFIAIITMQFASIPFSTILQVATISFSIKIFYSAVLAFPASVLVSFLKDFTGMDAFDIPKEFTSIEYSKNYAKNNEELI